MTGAAGQRRVVWSWALYDWANSAFATVVMAGLFPILFQDYWNASATPAVANLRLGWANGLASLVIVLIAPLLGAIADRAGRRKAMLLGFALPAAALTALLALVPAEMGWLAALLFVFATIGFMAANLFYDALLVGIAPPDRWHAVSGFGFGLGYLGGGLVYLGCIIAVLQPQWFGLASAADAALAAFVVTGAWWVLFTLPLAFNVPEPARLVPGPAAISGGLRQLRSTLTHLRVYRPVWLFLLAYFLYIDGVGTTIRMAVAYGRSLGFEQNDLMLALLITQFVGFPAALLMGTIGQRIGARRGILTGLLLYVVIAVWGAFIRSPWEFYVIAGLVGVAQGGVQALSRSFFAGLIPADRAGEFFGFYNVLGKSAALIGPPLFGALGVLFGDVRYSMLALVALFVGGALLLMLIDTREDSPT
ncbi:MFS transporter [Spiribacter vilamensis]|uniref:UMF1 family MFS transporter n=1 Tax=Spiribacter vilamensis TaxID=531306 RepID=A0A4Q8D0W1_9GAMM|nr:MFS transporter [Spiribacter vilamensis]RZU98976.1 UMF1 family MFS transporter [Spiribacter vilamensis]TVO62016.1 MFS transporter [Spiribacter vilamensis]